MKVIIKKGGPMTKEWKVEGMMCGHCKASVEAAVMSISGVESAEADVEKEIVTVTFGTEPVEEETIIAAIEEIGFDVVK